MLRRVGLRRTGISAKGRTPISRGSASKGVSATRQRQRGGGRLRRASSQAHEYVAFKLGLFELDRHVCQWCYDYRCRPLDPHHTKTPRATYLCDIETVITLGRACHDMATAAYSAKTGRLIITGTRSEGWSKSLVFAASKFEARAAGLA